MLKLTSIVVFAAAVSVSTLLEAQRAGAPGRNRTPGRNGTAGRDGARWYRPSGAWGGYGPTSTALEGARYGQAEVMRAAGEATESVSRAAINYQEAKSSYIDNAAKWTETYWQRKRLAQSEIEKDAAKMRDRRDRYLANKKPGGPPRIGVDQLDPTTGKLYWPEALTAPGYITYRKKLEELFLLRSHTSSTAGLANEIYTASRDMQSKLKSNIRKMQSYQYIAARKFLESLAYEGRFPAG